MPQFLPLGEVRPTQIRMPQPTDYSVIAQRQAATRQAQAQTQAQTQQMQNQQAMEQQYTDKIIAGEIIPKSINPETKRPDFNKAYEMYSQMASQDPKLGMYGLDKLNEARQSQNLADKAMLDYQNSFGQLGTAQSNFLSQIANDSNYEVNDQITWNVFRRLAQTAGITNLPPEYNEQAEQIYESYKKSPADLKWTFDPKEATLKLKPAPITRKILDNIEDPTLKELGNIALTSEDQRARKSARKQFWSLYKLPDMLSAKDKFSMENQLRNRYSQMSRDFSEVRDAYGRISAVGETGTAASDMALIFNYMKMLDPGSTVREGEYATVQNATNVPGMIRNTYNRAIEGSKLNVDQRKDFVERAEDLFNSQKNIQKMMKDQFEKIAKNSGLEQPSRITDIVPLEIRDYDPEMEGF